MHHIYIYDLHLIYICNFIIYIYIISLSISIDRVYPYLYRSPSSIYCIEWEKERGRGRKRERETLSLTHSQTNTLGLFFFHFWVHKLLIVLFPILRIGTLLSFDIMVLLPPSQKQFKDLMPHFSYVLYRSSRVVLYYVGCCFFFPSELFSHTSLTCWVISNLFLSLWALNKSVLMY